MLDNLTQVVVLIIFIKWLCIVKRYSVRLFLLLLLLFGLLLDISPDELVKQILEL